MTNAEIEQLILYALEHPDKAVPIPFLQVLVLNRIERHLENLAGDAGVVDCLSFGGMTLAESLANIVSLLRSGIPVERIS